MTVENKWKIFSVRQCFSTELTELQAVEVFDNLLKLDGSDEIFRYLQDHEHLIKWAPFENMPDCEFVELVEAQAKYAQMVANTPEVCSVLDDM